MGYNDFNINLPDGENFAPSPKRVEEISRLLLPGTFHLGYPWSNREKWEAKAGGPTAKTILEEARKVAKEEPRLYVDNAMYLRRLETDSPDEMNFVHRKIWSRLSLLPIAECLNPTGEYISILEEDILHLSRLKSWTHANNDPDRLVYDGKTIFADLVTAHYAGALVSIDYLLQDRLKPEIRQLVRDELEWRYFKPFRERIETGQDVYWWVTVDHNWNSVCTARMVACALALKEDLEERAWYVALAEKLIQYSEQGFEESGFYTEGVGYWVFGFGQYVHLAEIVRCVTDGKIDWLKKPLVERMSQFGARMEIQDGAYPSFADCQSDMVPATWLVNWMNNRNGTLDSERTTDEQVDSLKDLKLWFQEYLLLVLFHLKSPDEVYKMEFSSGQSDWFSDVQFLICRPLKGADSRLAATFKGGHNGVNHNHNDLGTFTVLGGNKELLVDPGAEVYSSRTFSKDRYDGNLLNSYGHPVPVVAGSLQVVGEEAYTTVLDESFSDEEDRVVLDLAKAYRVDTLKALKRTFSYVRSTYGFVEVVDEVAYSAPESFETALITYSDWKLNEDGTIRISQDGAAIDVAVSSEEGELEFSSCIIEESSTPTRLSWAFKEAVTDAKITIEIKLV